jgi:hypothetical protein
MIRFVDLTPWYWTDEDDPENPPVCAFLDTVTDRFVAVDGAQTFDCAEDVGGIPDEQLKLRCQALVPDGFWNRPRFDAS